MTRRLPFSLMVRHVNADVIRLCKSSDRHVVAFCRISSKRKGGIILSYENLWPERKNQDATDNKWEFWIR